MNKPNNSDIHQGVRCFKGSDKVKRGTRTDIELISKIPAIISGVHIINMSAKATPFKSARPSLLWDRGEEALWVKPTMNRREL